MCVMNFITCEDSIFIDNFCVHVLATRGYNFMQILSIEHMMFYLRDEVKRCIKIYSLTMLAYLNISTREMEHLRMGGFHENLFKN